MFRLFVPIILAGIAAGLFFVYTDPTYQHIKELRTQEMEYDEGLTKSKELLGLRNKLLAKYNTFTVVDLQKVERVLPDNVDNIRLILDTETIAQRYSLHVENIGIKTPQVSRSDRAPLAVGEANDPVGSVDFSFTVSARYEDFIRFLRDLERSVRVVDIKTISFSVGQGDLADYTVLVKTYWLR